MFHPTDLIFHFVLSGTLFLICVLIANAIYKRIETLSRRSSPTTPEEPMPEHVPQTDDTDLGGDNFVCGLERLIASIETRQRVLTMQHGGKPPRVEYGRLQMIHRGLTNAKRWYLTAVDAAEREVASYWSQSPDPLKRALGLWLREKGEFPDLDTFALDVEPPYGVD